MSGSCQLLGGNEAPAMALSHLKEKQTLEVGGGGLGKGLAGRSVLSLLGWCRKAGLQPCPPLAWALLQKPVFCWMDREAPGRVESCGTLCSSGWRWSFEQQLRRPQSVTKALSTPEHLGSSLKGPLLQGSGSSVHGPGCSFWLERVFRLSQYGWKSQAEAGHQEQLEFHS